MENNTRIRFFSAALATVLAAAVPMPMPAGATDALQRCRAPDGTIGYTDRSCAVFGAQAVPVPGGLLTRIARDEAREAGSDDPGSEGIDFNDMGATATPGRRSPVSGCARTPAQLAMDVHAALALGDVNRVAESYHFAGMSSEAGEHALDRLQRLIDRTVLDSRYFGPGNGGASAVDFEVRRYAGCYFVRFQDGAPGQTSTL